MKSEARTTRTAGAFFTPASLSFLRGLARHNKRPWFEAHRNDYLTFIKLPMQELIEQMDVRFARFAPEIVGDPRRSMFRIYRDVRFSKDKSPYKTHAACWFFHRDGTHNVGQDADGGGAGFYFHFQPGQMFVGGGMWMPPRPTLTRLRDAIVDDLKGFERVAANPALKRRFGGLSDEAMLKRTPRGFAPDHPAAKWLRYQSFIAGKDLREKDAVSPRLPQVLEREFTAMLPLVRWINGVLGLKAAKRR